MCRMQNCTEKYSPIVSLLHFFVFVFSCFGFRCRLFCRIRWMAAATAAATKHLRHACMHLIAIASNANCSWCTIAVLVGKQHADMPFHNVYHCFYAIILLLLLLLHFRIFFFFSSNIRMNYVWIHGQFSCIVLSFWSVGSSYSCAYERSEPCDVA